MSPLKTLVLLCCVSACGRQTVEFMSLVDAATDGAAHDAALADGLATDGPGADGALVDGAVVDGTLVDGAIVDGALVDGTVAIDGPALDALGLDAGLDAGIDGPGLDALILPDANLACAQSTVPLGSAAAFAVLAGSTVTNTGLTTVMGDLGVFPGTAVTNFPPGVLVGTQHAGDTAAMIAIGDLNTAYIDAAGRTLCPVSVSGNLGGMTLAPGLYKSTVGLAVSAGDLTLDAQGDSAAVFIFQMATTLNTTSGRKVLLINGAQAANIFWQVGSSATLGTTSVMQGTVMADQAITLATGAVLNGRALAHIAGVSLDASTVVKM